MVKLCDRKKGQESGEFYLSSASQLKLGMEIVKSDRCTPEVEVMFEVDPAFLIGWPDHPQDLN